MIFKSFVRIKHITLRKKHENFAGAVETIQCINSDMWKKRERKIRGQTKRSKKGRMRNKEKLDGDFAYNQLMISCHNSISFLKT